MGEIKFNPARLLECKTRLDYVTQEFQRYVDEALVLINDLEPERYYWLTQSVKGLIASIDGINFMAGKLARLANLYLECERAVENIVQRLSAPVPILSQQSAYSVPAPFITGYSVSHTVPRDLFVESWIMELMYLEAGSPGEN